MASAPPNVPATRVAAAAGPRSSGRRPRTCRASCHADVDRVDRVASRRRRRAASRRAATARRIRHGPRAGEVQRCRGPGVVRREPGEVERRRAGPRPRSRPRRCRRHRARGRDAARAGWASPATRAGVATVCAAWAVGERAAAPRPRPAVHHAPRVFRRAGGADVAAAAREGDLPGEQVPSTCAQSSGGGRGRCWRRRRSYFRALLAPRRATRRVSVQQQGREQRRQRVEQGPARRRRPGQGFVVLALRRRERRDA